VQNFGKYEIFFRKPFSKMLQPLTPLSCSLSLSRIAPFPPPPPLADLAKQPPNTDLEQQPPWHRSRTEPPPPPTHTDLEQNPPPLASISHRSTPRAPISLSLARCGSRCRLGFADLSHQAVTHGFLLGFGLVSGWVWVAGNGGSHFLWIPVVLGVGFFYCFVLRCSKHTM
jgi:hypothetical protein